MTRGKIQPESDYPFLFSPFRLGPFDLKNRIVALPVFTGYAHPDGRVSPLLIDFYARMADSGAALVVVANAAVSWDSIVSEYNLRADRDEFIPGLARLAEAVKQRGALACLQLNHGGRFARTDQPLQPSPIDRTNLSFNLSALTEFMHFFSIEKRFRMTRYFLGKLNAWRRTMNNADLERVILDFRNAAVRACQAGFDMIELHGASGYLLCQFLSAFSNKTAGAFGGNFMRRTAFPLAVLREIKQALPENFPIGFRLLLREWVPDGIDFSESLAFAGLLEKEGIAYLSASVGSYNSIFSASAMKTMAKPAYLKKDMAGLTAEIHVPTIISGRITTPMLAETLLRDRVTDLIGLGRPLRVDFDWIKKAAGGNPRITACINCNGCLKRVILEQGFVCTLWPKLMQERTELEHKLLSRNYRSLWVITDRKDMEVFRSALPRFLPDNPIAFAFPPTVLFPHPEEKDSGFEAEIDSFLRWSMELPHCSGWKEKVYIPVIRMAKERLEKTARQVSVQGGYGLIFIARHPEQVWRTQLLYQLRCRVLVLLGTDRQQNRVIVPVDLSPATSLILMFLQRNYIRRPDFDLTFVHALTGSAGQAEQRWKAIQKVTGAEQFPLTLLPCEGDAVSAIVKAVHQGQYGTVIMGKRGISGIKRWLLGSVSRGVMGSLTEHSLVLID